MSGKPSARPAAPAKPTAGKPGAAKAKPSAAKSAPKGGKATSPRPASQAATGKKQAREEAEAVDSDDPFAVDPTAGKNAVAASPKPSAARPLKVVCPMCETTGYIPRKAAGKDVRCPNPDCRVPVFKAPLPDRGELDSGDKKATGNSKKMVWIGGGVAAVAITGGLIAYFMPDDDVVIQNPVPIFTGDGEDNGETIPGDNGAREPVATGPTKAEIIDDALKAIVTAARDNDKNRSKPYCRQLGAEAHLFTNDFEGARTQLQRLVFVGRQLTYYQIRPLAVMAVRQQRAGNATQAQESLDEASKLVSRLPSFGREPVDLVTALAIAAAAQGKTDEAFRLIDRFGRQDEAGELSAYLLIWWAYQTQGLQPPDLNWSAMWVEPQWVAVTLGVCSQGFLDASQQWLNRVPDGRVRADCLAAWTAAVMHSAGDAELAAALARIDGVLAAQPAAVQARMQAIVARQLHVRSQTDGATTRLAQAVQSMAEVTVPPPMTMPELKEIINGSVPGTDEAWLLGLGLAEIAAAQAEIGLLPESWETYSRGLDALRAAGPSPVLLARMLSQADSPAMASQLRRELNLNNDIRVRAAIRNYARKLDDWKALADERFAAQVELLNAAARSGNAEKAWQEVQQRAGQQDPNSREDYYTSAVPLVLAFAFRDAQNQSTAAEIEQVIARNRTPSDAYLRAQLRVFVNRELQGKQFARAVQWITRTNVEDAWKIRVALDAMTTLANERPLAEATAFLTALSDPISRELAAGRMAALVSARDLEAARGIWQYFGEAESLSPTERASLLHGMVAGMQRVPADPEPDPPETDSDAAQPAAAVTGPAPLLAGSRP